MPTRKQRRRREKQKRHEWEEVYVDEDGNELDPDEAEEIVGPSGRTKAEKGQAKQAAGRRAIEPPSLRRTLRRGLLFFPLMVLTVFLLTGDDLSTAEKIAQAFFLLLIFLPFTHFMDVLLWRSYQRRQEKAADAKKR
jgi:cation transport ATPase